MTPQELRSSIIQQAIQGKLVEQRPEEGTGEELFQQIQAEKQALVKAGKLKNEKSLPEFTEDDIPFDIPDTWKWVQLGDIANINGGFAFKSTNYTADGVRVIRISDFNELGFVNDKIVRHPYDDSLSSYELEEKNILLCMTGGTVGKSLFVSHMDERMVVNQRVATIKVNRVLPEYIYQVILSPMIQKVIQKSKNSTNDNISMDTIKGFLTPLPPIGEQKRIVAKLDGILPLIDRYEAAWNKLEEFNKRFPSDMQKSILQLAIQGKLVEQRPEEGTGEELFQQIQAEKQALIKAGKIKKEKPLPEIAEDEIPFEIPDTWKWVRLSDVIDVRDGTHDTPGYLPSGYPLITGKDFYYGHFDLSKTQYISEADYLAISQRSKVDPYDILFSMIGGNIGSMIMVTPDNYFEMAIKNVALFKQYFPNDILPKYLYYFLKSQVDQMKSGAKGGAQMFVSLKMLRSYPFPFPPLAEQKRIVAKLEEILPLCDRLK